MFEDELWDEHRWEAFLLESDRRVDRFMDLFLGFLADCPPPEDGDVKTRRVWEEKLREFLREKGFQPDDRSLAFLFEDQSGDKDSSSEDNTPYSDESLFEDDEIESEGIPVEELPIYRQAFDLAAEVLEWANDLPGEIKDSALVQFCTHITQIPANIAKGHSIGSERDMIGGNIACSKRGLMAANSALVALRDLKYASYMDAELYLRFYELTFEVRNALGLHIQDLRKRFELGID